MKNLFNDYFGFNRQQRNGVFVLISIIFLLFLLRMAYPYFMAPDEVVLKNLPVIEKKPDSSRLVKFEKRDLPELKAQPAGKADLFVFDPNTVTKEQLVKLGIKEKTAKRFIKFRSKGFVFRQKEDLKKVYGISATVYQKLEPYILIEPPKKQETKENYAQKNKEPEKQTQPVEKTLSISSQSIELNSADSAMLVSIKGIGPSYARRIIKYRDMLGGFLKVEQLKEVYGFTEELFNKTKEQFYVKSAAVKKLKISSDDFKAINRHPYFSYELTKSVMQWRKKTVITPSNLRDMFNDDEMYQKALPYIDFD